MKVFYVNLNNQNYCSMFLFAEYLNEGSSVPLKAKGKDKELKEGRDPKNNNVPHSSLDHWHIRKRESLVNQKWERLRHNR